MAEVHQVRLVRCPICKNLLLEHPGCSIYRCGACDSVLQAKKKVSASGGGSLEEPRKEGRNGEVFVEPENNLGYAYERSSNGPSGNNRRKEIRVAKQRALHVDSDTILKGRNLSHGNRAEKGPYSSQLEGIGDGSWRSRVNSSNGSSYLPGLHVHSNLNRPSKTTRAKQDQGLMWKLDELVERANCESTRRCCSHHASGKHLHGVSDSYIRQCGLGPVLYPQRCEMKMQELSALQNDLCQARTSTSSDPFRPKTCPHWQQPSHDHFPKRFLFADQQFQIPYTCQPASNRPSCSCLNCETCKLRASSRGPPSVPGLRGVSRNQMDSNYNCHANPVSFGPSKTDRSTESSMSQLRDEQSKVRWQSSVDSDTDSFDWYRRPTRRVPELSGSRTRLCHPVSGGAPFIVCRNCLELLRLPNVLNWRQKNRPRKLQCGACSMELSLRIQNKKLSISLSGKKREASDRNHDTVSLQGEKKQASDRDHDFSGDVSNNVDSDANYRLSASSVTPEVDKKDSGKAFGSPKSEENTVLPAVQVLNASDDTERRSLDASSSLVGGEADALEAISTHKDASSSPDLPLKHEEPTSQGSYCHDHLNNAASDDNIDRVGEGNGIGLDEMNEVEDDKFSSGQRSGEKDEIVSTEVDVSFQEYLKSDLSQEYSNESSEEAKGTRISNGVESFSVNAVKNSVRDLSLSSQGKGRTNEAPEVYVNGQPILPHQVVKAEKLAGPISPGNYWYDWQAGFWGVIGLPCLGILPPFIEEFIYPMPASCGAGNTAVFVNGRELHENDLELLSRKGLPTSRDKLFVVDFFGRVVDKDSGEEVANLGKLAPTVERQNRGFGMRVPGEVL